MKDILIAFVHVFAMMAPWLVFGFLMAGIIAVWIPRSWVNRMMGVGSVPRNNDSLQSGPPGRHGASQMLFKVEP